jgi:PAS domain-containing protein
LSSTTYPTLSFVHRDGIIRYVNPAMVNTLEIQPEEVLGRPPIDYIAPRVPCTCGAAMRKRLEGSDPLNPTNRSHIRHRGRRDRESSAVQ